MIHYRNRQGQTRLARESPIATNTELDKPDSLDTNIVCMFTNGTADCPNIIKRVKNTIENNLRRGLSVYLPPSEIIWKFCLLTVRSLLFYLKDIKYFCQFK